LQLCDYWKRVPSCIFDSRSVCESILKRLHTHANQRVRSQAKETILKRCWSLCNPATVASLYKQLTLDTFQFASENSGWVPFARVSMDVAHPHCLSCAVVLAGEEFISEKQKEFKNLRVRGNRLVIYNQIMQPPKGITAEDTHLAKLAFKLSDANENRPV
jgi:hypothetical protein